MYVSVFVPVPYCFDHHFLYSFVGVAIDCRRHLGVSNRESVDRGNVPGFSPTRLSNSCFLFFLVVCELYIYWGDSLPKKLFLRLCT